MASERKIGGLSFLVTTLVLVVVVLGLPAAAAVAVASHGCVEDCYTVCDMMVKKDDVPSCSKDCDAMCRDKFSKETEFHKATLAEKVAICKKRAKEDVAAGGSSDATLYPGFAKLKAGCLRECNNNIKKEDVCTTSSSKKEEDCGGKMMTTAGCDTLCQADAEDLTYSSAAYSYTPDAEKKALVARSGGDEKVEASAATCIGVYSKMCDKDPSCLYTCDSGCRAKAVISALDKEAINKD